MEHETKKKDKGEKKTETVRKTESFSNDKNNKKSIRATASTTVEPKTPVRKFKKRAPVGGRNGQDELEQRILDIARITRVMAGGKRMRFRACVALGNKKGKVAIGLDKGADVTIAVTKAVNKAKKNIIDVPIVHDTIPHGIYQKYSAAKILFKPARKGRGIIAGGVVHIILELAGVKNVTSKILGTNNKVNNAKCVMEALKNLKKVEKKAEKKGDKKDKGDKNEKVNHSKS